MATGKASRQTDFIVVAPSATGSGWLRWSMRLGLWGIGAVGLWLLGVMLVGAHVASNVTRCANSVGFYQQTPPAPASARAGKALLTTRAIADCLDREGGYFARRSGAADIAAIRHQATHPPELIGLWNVRRADLAYQIRLHREGYFELLSADPHFPGGSGTWSVHGDRIFWGFDDAVRWPPDLNPMVRRSSDAFELTERNGQKTAFDRAR